jgi:hypothetical protein
MHPGIMMMTQPCGGVLRQGMDMKRALRPRTYKWQTAESNARVILAALINPLHTYIHTLICATSSTDDPVTLGQLTLAVQRL